MTMPARIAAAVCAWLAVSASAMGQTTDVRGLDFTSFIHLERGMTEGQVLSVAGQPDLLADQGLTERYFVQTDGTKIARSALVVRTYTYLPTEADPFTTTITLVGGQVTDIRRDRKF